MLSLRETVFRRLRLQKKARRQKQNRHPRSVQLEDLEPRKLLTAALYANVPEAAAYTLVYDLAIANDASYRNTTPVAYTTNNSASVAIGSFDRIAYYLELDTGTGLEYMFVSMDAFTSDASKIGLPHNVNNPVVFQQRVNNMNVVSNKPGIVTGTGITTGNIEFWPSNYGTSNAIGIPNASGTAFDFGDGGASASAGYGSFQVHNYDLDGAGPGTAGQTLFAYNDWGGGSPGDGNDLGIGNRGSGNPDWTFANNTSSYTVKNLQILVRPFTSASNEAPVNTVPGTQTVWVGQTIVFSTANGNAISVSDDSGPSGMLQMTLTANTGTLTLATTSGLTFTTGDGTADTTMKFRGTQTDLVAALDGLAYTSTTGGVGTLTITTDDLGSSASNPSGDAAGRIDNGGFEVPFVPNNSFRLFDESLVPPWSTTDSRNQIEIWGNGFLGVPAFEGRQFAEINANSAGTLSTTVQPTAGRNTEFAFAHRARRLSNEQIRVVVTDLGADGVLGGGNDTVLLNKVYTDGTTTWGSYQENLGFSTGNKLLLQFTAVNPPNGDQFQSFGNFLDGIRFGVITLTDTDTVTINNLAPPSVPTDTVAPAGATISEGLANGSAVGITARSTDPNGAPITYSLTNNAGGRFAINPTTGVVTVANSTLLDGPGSHIITVQASDGTDPVRGISSANFTITVTNVAPTATFVNGGAVNEGSTGTVSFSNQFDPSTADTTAGFHYAYDFDNDGTFDSGDGSYAGSGSSASVIVPSSFLADGPGTRTVKGRIIDKNGGLTDYTTVITVNNVAPSVANAGNVSVNEGSTVTNSGTWSDPGLDVVTLSASVGTVTKNADGTWSWSFNTNDGPDQSQTVTITATDSDGASTSTTFALTVNNVAPSIANAGDVSINEGSTVANSGTWSDPGLDSVTLAASVGTVTKNPDGTWSWSFNTNDGPDQSQTVTITATDSDGASTTTSFNLTVNNVAPDAVNDSYSTPQATLLTGNVITDIGADTDPAGANDPLTVVAVNGVASSFGQAIALSNGTLTMNADGSFSYQPATTFVGSESFTYTISDGDGGFDSATVTIVVNAAAEGGILTVVDTCCDGGTALLITGTSQNDHIVVSPGSTSTTLHVNVNGVISTVARPSGRIIVLGLAGNDNIQIAGAISNSVWLYGDEGDDRLNAGNVSAGGNLLFGGDGNDDLLGGNGRDIMIGGQGADKITANADDDILIAGLTTHDDRASAGHDAFWCNVLHEWTELDLFTTRVNRLRTGSGHTGANLLASVLDDNSADQIDQLQGSAGNDWFLFESGEDKITGQTESTN